MNRVAYPIGTTYFLRRFGQGLLLLFMLAAVFTAIGACSGRRLLRNFSQDSIIRSDTPSANTVNVPGIDQFPAKSLSPVPVWSSATIDEALAELRELESPAGVNPYLFSKLKVELERALSDRGPNRFLSNKTPTQVLNGGIQLVGNSNGLRWNEVGEGDWNNDGIVKADDLIPIAIHFGKSDDPASPDHYKYAEYIDGDGDGVIGIGDLQAIADHFGESTIGYSIYEALDSNGTGMTKVATILRPPVPADLENPPWNISFATLQYDTSQGVIEVESAATKQEQVTRSGTDVLPVNDLGQDGQATAQLGRDDHATYNLDHQVQSTTVPPGWVPTPGKFYSVVPYGQGFDEQGAPIFVERFNLASNWAYINIPPVAIFEAFPVSGEAPVTVTFDARDSYDVDGYITNYLWDFDGDGLTDTVTQTPITTYEFTAPSINPASLLIYDNAGAPSPKLTLPLHIAGWVYEEIVDSNTVPLISYPLLLYSGDIPHIVYFGGGKRILWYAWRTQGVWKRESVLVLEEGAAAIPYLLFIDSNGDPMVVYVVHRVGDSEFPKPLFYARRHRENEWRSSTIDPEVAGVTCATAFSEGRALIGLSAGTAVEPHPAVYFYEKGGWKKEIVDPDRYSYSVKDLFLDPEGNPVAYYIDESLPQNSMLATRRGGVWGEFEILGPYDEYGLWSRYNKSFAYSMEGTLTVVQVQSGGMLLVGMNRGAGWETRALDFSAGSIPDTVNLLYDDNGVLWIMVVLMLSEPDDARLTVLSIRETDWIQTVLGPLGVRFCSAAKSGTGTLGVAFSANHNRGQALYESRLWFSERVSP